MMKLVTLQIVFFAAAEQRAALRSSWQDRQAVHNPARQGALALPWGDVPCMRFDIGTICCQRLELLTCSMIFVFDSLFSSSTLLGQVIPWEYLLLSRFKAQASIIKEKRYQHIYIFKTKDLELKMTLYWCPRAQLSMTTLNIRSMRGTTKSTTATVDYSTTIPQAASLKVVVSRDPRSLAKKIFKVTKSLATATRTRQQECFWGDLETLFQSMLRRKMSLFELVSIPFLNSGT